jgi:lipopolysaccharide/colanic/teichoic acid biosynthesis glycosyltransferase
VYHDTTMRRVDALGPFEPRVRQRTDDRRSTRGDGPGRGAGRGFDPSRVVDVALAGGVLIFFAPLMLVIALLIWLQDGSGPFFGHRRIGRGGREFACLKFRSMVPNAEAKLNALLAADAQARREWQAEQKLRNDPRVTPLGDFLRRSSLDELPQLINVLRGDMSIVGPRPIVRAEVGRYGRSFDAYCAVRPGITGLWQVSGRSDVSYRRRVALDRLYVRTRSLWRDLGILAMTLPAVLLRRGSR